MSRLFTQIEDLQKVNSLSDARELHDPETVSSSGASHVSSQTLTLSSRRGMPCRESRLPHNTLDTRGTSGNVFESPLARKGPPSAFFENSRNLSSSSCGMRQNAAGTTKVK